MFQLSFAILLLALVQSTQGAGHLKTAYAQFDARGVQGRISFEDDGVRVQITTSFQSLPEDTGLDYHVHDWPVEYTTDPAGRCDEVGGHYDPYDKGSVADYANVCAADKNECEVGDLASKHGKLYISEEVVDDTFGLSLRGFHSILFRSIVIHGTGVRLTCATIQPDTAGGILSARARFNGPRIGGSIWFFQASSSARDTYIHSDLFLTDSGADLTDYDWSIYTSPTGTDGRKGLCSGVGNTRFTTRAGSVTCDPSDASTCHEHQLSAKHGNLTIRRRGMGRNRGSFSEYDGITLSGENSIAGMSVSVGAAVLACATIKRVSFIRAKAEFSTYSIEAVEYSPFLPTNLRYTGEPANITGQSIHTEGYYSGRNCNADLQVYSPFTPFTQTGENITQDVNETGDLSSLISSTWVWHNSLPLSGPYSTIGRTASIKKDGVWECAEFQDDFSYRGDDASYIYRARAVFEPSPCWVSFTQRVSSDTYEPESVTPMYLPDFDSGEVTIFDYCPAGSPTRKYVIQTGTVTTTDTTRYNPYGVKTEAMGSTEYSEDCLPITAERCEVGDLQRLELNQTRWTGIHTNLELLGRFRTTARILRLYTDDGSVNETAEIEPLYSDSFTACTCGCNVAGNKIYTVENPHQLVDFTCKFAILSPTCNFGEYEVNGRATGASEEEARDNAVTFSQLVNTGDHLRAAFMFTILSMVLLSLLYMY